MTAHRAASYHREIADRNIEAILDAAEELLELQGHATISAVAAQAGVSRVTVYAHSRPGTRCWRRPSNAPWARR